MRGCECACTPPPAWAGTAGTRAAAPPSGEKQGPRGLPGAECSVRWGEKAGWERGTGAGAEAWLWESSWGSGEGTSSGSQQEAPLSTVTLFPHLRPEPVNPCSEVGTLAVRCLS